MSRILSQFFGFGLGGNIKMDGMSYLEFVIPGIIAMTAMNSNMMI